MKNKNIFPKDKARLEKIFMKSRIQQLAEEIGMTYDEFIGEIRKRGCSEPTAAKIWSGSYEHFENFKDNDINLSNLRKAADVFDVRVKELLP